MTEPVRRLVARAVQALGTFTTDVMLVVGCVLVGIAMLPVWIGRGVGRLRRWSELHTRYGGDRTAQAQAHERARWRES